MTWRFIFDVVSIFMAGAIIGAVIAMRWLAKADRLDSPEDRAARERMFDDAERSFYAARRTQNTPE